MIAIVLDGICIVTRIEGEVKAKAGTWALGRFLRTHTKANGHPEVIQTSRRLSAFKARGGDDVSEDLLMRFCDSSCSPILSALRLRCRFVPSDLHATPRKQHQHFTNFARSYRSLLKQLITHLLSFVVPPAIITHTSPVPETSSQSRVKFIWRRGTLPRVCWPDLHRDSPAFPNPSGTPPSFCREHDVLLPLPLCTACAGWTTTRVSESATL